MSNIEKAKVILEMLEHFEQQHSSLTRALIEEGEGKRCQPFDRVRVDTIKEYVSDLIFKQENSDEKV